MINLVIDIGNTHAKFAWFKQGKLIEMLRHDVSSLIDVKSIVNKKPADKAIISSVGSLDPEIIAEFEKVHNKLIILDHNTPLPISISYSTPETLGHDRIAAASGALQIYPNTNVLIIDMGTAITIDFISAEGKFLGGNISPGLHTRFRALNQYTAKLPLVTGDSNFPLFGTDTNTAIIAGVQQGIVFEIDRYMDEFTLHYPDCEFIITGGDASFFVSKFKRPIFAMPELVLTGLNFILEFNASGKIQ
jgi:type III pantothenate kinase